MNEAGLYSSVGAAGKVRTSLAAIREKLDAVPAMRRVSAGTMIRYELLGEPNSILYISPNRIVIRYRYDAGAKPRNSALAKLLAVTAVLRGDYEVDFWSAYQEIIEALTHGADTTARESQARSERLERQLDALALSNFNLSREVIDLENRIGSIKAEMELYSEVLSKVEEYCDGMIDGGSRAERLGAIVGSELASRICKATDDHTGLIGKMALWKHTTR